MNVKLYAAAGMAAVQSQKYNDAASDF